MDSARYQLDIIETLYRFDEPLLFVARVGMMQALFLKTDETDQGHEFLTCYIDKSHIEGLREGRISVRGAYEAQDDLAIVETDFDYVVHSTAAYNRDASEVAARLPESGVGVFPRMGECPDALQEKDSLLSVYFKGAGLSRDRIAYGTLMGLLGKVRKFVQNEIAPPELRGLHASTFDFTLGDPALGSLMISVKEPTFDLGKLRQGKNRRDITRDQLTVGVHQKADELFTEMEDLIDVDQVADSGTGDAYYSVKDLLPTESTPYQTIMFSTSAGSGFRRVSIDKTRADIVRQAYENGEWVPSSRNGAIVEINSASRTCLLRALTTYRITTCAFGAETFDALRANRDFKLGAKLQVSGDFLRRARRDYLVVRSVDGLEGP